LCFSLPYIGIQWIECSGTELTIFIAVLLDKTSFTVYIIIYNIVYVFYSANGALQVMSIISLSKYLTSYPTEKTKKLIYYIFVYITIVAVIMLAIILALNINLLKAYMKDPEVLSAGKNIFFAIPIGIITNLYMAVIGCILCSLGKVKLVFSTMISIFMGAGIFFSYIFAIYLKKDLYGIYVTFIITTMTIIVIYVFVLLNIDMEESKRIAFQNLEEQNQAEQYMANEIEEERKLLL